MKQPVTATVAYRALIFGLSLVISACATAPASRFYTLSTFAPAQTAASSDTALAIGPIDLPQYLDRPQIVTRPEPNRLTVDEFNRWGGSLDEEIDRALSENLANLLGTQRIYSYPNRIVADARYRVAVNIRIFDGRLGDSVRLNLSWSIIDERIAQIIRTDQATYEARVSGDDYNAYVAALSNTLQQFSRDLARGLAAVID